MLKKCQKCDEWPLNCNYMLSTAFQCSELYIYMTKMYTAWYTNVFQVVRVWVSSRGWILSLHSTHLITVVQPTEQWLSGCAASFMAFYHHHQPWHPLINVLNSSLVCVKRYVAIISLLIYIFRSFLPNQQPQEPRYQPPHPQPCAQALQRGNTFYNLQQLWWHHHYQWRRWWWSLMLCHSYQSGPQSHSDPPSTPHSDIRSITMEQWILAPPNDVQYIKGFDISHHPAWEALRKAKLAITMTTKMMTTMVGAGQSYSDAGPWEYWGEGWWERRAFRKHAGGERHWGGGCNEDWDDDSQWWQ